MKTKRIHLQSGLSLIEVLILVTMITLVFLAVAFATSQSMKQTKYNEQKLIGARFADELEEWLRGEKEEDWNTFYEQRSGVSAKTYCFDDSVYDADNHMSWPSEGACGANSYNLRSVYKREVSLIQNLTSQVNVIITVWWRDGPNIYSIPVTTIFSRWE